MRIFVVDDEMYTREICCDFLIEEGYENESAENGKDALEVLKVKTFDILLTDIQMPQMDGVALLKESRQLYPQMEVILMTAFGGLQSAVEAIRSGAYDYLTKPLARASLLNTIRRCGEKLELQRKLNESQAKLIEQEKLAALGSVSSWLSHRMRNSLSVILMCAHYLNERALDQVSQELKDVILAIIDKTKVLEKITADLIAYSRSYELEKNSENLNSILDEVAQSFAVQMQIQGVELRKNFDQNFPEIPCDPHLLNEVFENIFVNALQAIGSQTGQFIQLKTEVLSSEQKVDCVVSQLMVTIENSGSLIPKEIIEKIFTPFFTTKENGSGLGLSIVKKIIGQHGGNVIIESNVVNSVKLTQIKMSFPSVVKIVDKK